MFHSISPVLFRVPSFFHPSHPSPNGPLPSALATHRPGPTGGYPGGDALAALLSSRTPQASPEHPLSGHWEPGTGPVTSTGGLLVRLESPNSDANLLHDLGQTCPLLGSVCLLTNW